MSMTWGQVADVCVTTTREYRTKHRRSEMETYGGMRLTPVLAKAILEPLASWLVDRGVPKDLAVNRLEQYCADCVASVPRDQHMHRAQQIDSFDGDMLDALLVGYANALCAPLDLALYATDLEG